MLPLAEAAYDLTKLPSDWKLISTIQPNDFGFVAQQEDGTTVISFRGTEHEAEWLDNFEAILIPWIHGGYVHCGFFEQSNALAPSIEKVIPILGFVSTLESPSPLPKPGTKLLITGHSLGACMAVLCASKYRQYSPLVYTFAGPRVGTFGFAKDFNAGVPECYRVVNLWDVVPHVPSCIGGFIHVGTGVELKPHYTPDPYRAHSLEFSYRPGLEQLIGTPQMAKVA